MAKFKKGDFVKVNKDGELYRVVQYIGRFNVRLEYKSGDAWVSGGIVDEDFLTKAKQGK